MEGLRQAKDKKKFAEEWLMKTDPKTGAITVSRVRDDGQPMPDKVVKGGANEVLAALNSFKDPMGVLYEVVRIGGENYALGVKNKVKIFYRHRNPHYFRYFTKVQQ
jgi:hypothetical protein